MGPLLKIKTAIILSVLMTSAYADLDALNQSFRDGSFLTGHRSSHHRSYRNDYRDLEEQTHRQRVSDAIFLERLERSTNRTNDFLEQQMMDLIDR
jgi:hypothetical protein